MSEIKRYTACIDGVPVSRQVVLAEDFDATLARMDALREDLSSWKARCSRRVDDIKLVIEERNELRERRDFAQEFVHKMAEAAKGQESIATGYLSDILDALQGK